MSQNVLTANGEEIPLTYFRAHLHDNAEGVLIYRTELRILLADREVPADAMNGIAFDLPVEVMAKEGKVRGLLLKLDPADLGQVSIILLQQTDNPRESLPLETFTSSKKDTIKQFAVTGGIVSGTIEHEGDGDSTFASLPEISYSISFKAPLSHEPAITADLKGKAAQDSLLAKIVYKKGEALEKGDIEALKALTSEQANRRNEPFLKDQRFIAGARQLGAEMKKSIKSIRRAVERGDSATLLFEDNISATFVREGNEWKSDN